MKDIAPSFNITDQDVKKFQALYKKHFDIELDSIEARRKCSLLVLQMHHVYRPITKQQLKALEDKDRSKN